uniref:PAS domain-containing protein n=1 Tax=Rhizophora mucronata TaxID=61149 RepID=A0A2P2L7L1_RHIMU
METPPAEELLRKIQELEAGHAQLREEMSKLKLSADPGPERPRQQRSHSISPQRTATRRRSGPCHESGAAAAAAWKTGSASFRHASPLQRETRNSSNDSNNAGNSAAKRGGANTGPSAVNFTDRQYLNILQSMGQSVHIFDLGGRIIYWNRSAEHLYGYSAIDALGKDAIELVADPQDYAVANNIVHRVTMGESWTGQFPVKNRMGERFVIVATNTPFYDDDSTLVGIICVSSDSRTFQEMKGASPASRSSETNSNFSRPGTSITTKLGLDSQQPLQAAIASKISNLASKVSNKVKSKIRTGENSIEREGGSGGSHYSDYGFSDAMVSDHREDANSSGASTPRGDAHSFPVSMFSHVDENSPTKPSRDSGDESEGKPAIHKIIASKAEALIGKKGLSWPWKNNEKEGLEARNTRFGRSWLQNDQENEIKSLPSSLKTEAQASDNTRPTTTEASGSWSSVNVNSTSSPSSCGSTSSSVINKVDMETDYLDYEIPWEDLTFGEQIGQGSCGTVYHALWYGSDVAVKVFPKQEYSDDAIISFRQEVCLLSHSPFLLFVYLQPNQTQAYAFKSCCFLLPQCNW